MKIPSAHREEGYTLVETLVAMAVFLSAAIPLGATVGNLLLDDHSGTMARALYAAESEMSRIVVTSQIDDGISADSIQGMLVKRTSFRRGALVEVTVEISSPRNPQDILLSINKSFLRY